MTPRVPPHNEQDEAFVLGSMMIDREACDVAIEMLNPPDFYLPHNSLLFEIIRRLHIAGQATDLPAVASEMQRLNELHNVGGAEFLTSKMDIVSTSAHIKFHAENVKNYSILRSLISGCAQIVEACYQHEEEPKAILERAEKHIYAVSEHGSRQGLALLKESIHDEIASLEKLQRSETKTVGLSTGFPQLDKITAGFHPGNMIVLAARPGMGKSALALDIIRNTILRGQPTAFFSLEMTRSEIFNRLVSAISNVSLYNIRTGFIGPQAWLSINAAAEKLYSAPLYLDCSTLNVSATGIRSSCRRLAGRLARDGKKLGLIVVDYLQLLSSTMKRYENRQAEVADISRSLKMMAMDLGVPVLALSQLNRQTEEAGRGGRPRLADLRESGSIEQDADLVAFIYREALYKANATDEEKSASKLIIAKHRNGAMGEIDMFFVKENTKFIEVEKEEEITI